MWADRRFAGIEKLYARPPKDALVRVPDSVLKTAVFLGLDAPTGREYGGTGYCIEILYEGDEPTRITLLATAAHVAGKLEGFDFYIRANRKDGSLAEVKIDCSEQWWYHPTEREAVDAAVMILPLGFTQDLDIIEITEYGFVNKRISDERGLGVGDEVFVAGLFKKAKGAAKNIPIIRVGNVAMTPDEKIPFPTEENPNQEIYANLLECRSTGGLSGSPVFIRETIQTRWGFSAASGRPDRSAEQFVSGNFYFYGSMIGHWHVEIPLSDGQREAVNMGVAPMVPSQKIYEVINQKGLLAAMKKIHDEATKEKQSKNGVAVMDDGFAERRVFTKEDFEGALKKATRKVDEKKTQP